MLNVGEMGERDFQPATKRPELVPVRCRHGALHRELNAEPDPETKELVLTELHPDVEPAQAREQTGWDLRVAEQPSRIEPPTAEELSALRTLSSR